MIYYIARDLMNTHGKHKRDADFNWRQMFL